MSKYLQPADCLRGHQIIATERLVAMLEREGFYCRDGNGGSHKRYIHEKYAEIGFNIVVNTLKRDSQVRAAKAVERARELDKKKTKPTAHEKWMRDIVGRLNAASEEFEMGDDKITLRSRSYPFLGLDIAFDAPADTVRQKIEELRWHVSSIHHRIENYETIYGIEHSLDEDGVSHFYQPEWRTALTLEPYAEHRTLPDAAFNAWESILRDLRKTQTQADKLDATAQTLRARYPDDVILRDANTIIIRDGMAPQIGTVICANATDEDIAQKHRAMKTAGLAFATRLQKMVDQFEFRHHTGKRTLYIDHTVYERINGTVKLFTRTGDNEQAFAAMDALEAAVEKRDENFKLSLANYDSIKTLCTEFSQREEGGVRITEGVCRQMGTNNTKPIRVVDSIQGRRSIEQDAQFAHAILELQSANFERAVMGLGFRASRLEDGTLRLTHAFYDNMVLDFPRYDEAVAAIRDLKNLGDACKNGDPAALDRFLDAEKLGAEDFMGMFSQAINVMHERCAALHDEYADIEDRLILKFGYIKTTSRVHGQRWLLHYTKADASRGLGPMRFSVPIAKLVNFKNEEIYIVTEKTLEDLRENLRKQYSAAPAVLSPQGLKDAAAFAFTSLTPPTQQNIEGALASIGLTGAGRPQYKAI